MHDDVDLIARLRAIRKELKLSQREYAERLDISCPAVSEIEGGKYKPNFDYMYKLVKLFHVNIAYIMFGEGEMFKNQAPFPSTTVYAVKQEYIDRLFFYFERSTLVQLFVVGEFEGYLLNNRENIDAQVKLFEKQNK